MKHGMKPDRMLSADKKNVASNTPTYMQRSDYGNPIRGDQINIALSLIHLVVLGSI